MDENFKPEIVVLFCRQSVDPATDISAVIGLLQVGRSRLVALPCSSKTDVPHILKVLEDGADGVLIVACPDKACRFMVGNVRAEKRIRYVHDLLESAGLGGARISLIRGVGLTADNLAEQVDQQALAVRSLGINPIKSWPIKGEN
ncbi:MAG: hydrogenase iron-sulfur subunit [Desulfatirhabdiaceae bacterium]